MPTISPNGFAKIRLSFSIRFTGVVIRLLNSALIGLMDYLLNNGKKGSVKSFDASGIARGDRKHFLWRDFRGEIKRTGRNLYGGTHSWRTNLVFENGGVVWAISQRIKNYDEIFKFFDALPRAGLIKN